MSKSPDEPSRRHSVAASPELISDQTLLAQTEAKNGLRQFDCGIRVVADALSKGVDFKWRVSLIQALHREALQGISEFAGNWERILSRRRPSISANISMLIATTGLRFICRPMPCGG